MFKEIKKILSINDYKKLKFLFFLNSLTFFLEFLSLSSIPIFVTILVDPNFIQNKIHNYEILFYFKNLEQTELLFIVSLLMVGLFFFKNTYLAFIIYKQGKFYEKIGVDLSLRLFNGYLSMPYINHLKANPADLTRNITNNCGAFTIYIDHIYSLIREITAVFVIFLLLIWASPVVIIGVFIFLTTLTFIYMSKIKPVIDSRSNKNNKINRENIKSINEIFGSIRDLKVQMKENEILNQFKKNIVDLEKNTFFFKIFDKAPRIIIELIAIICISFIAIFLVSSSQNIQYLIPILSLLTISIFRFIPAFLAISSARYYTNLLTPNLKNLSSAIDDVLNHKEQEKKSINTLTSFDKNLENKFLSIKDISFSYPDSKTSPLKNISFDIEKNKIIGITGETGAGKSTLFYIMLSLLSPTQGAIFNYGRNIHHEGSNWKKKLGYISQNIFLFDTTIEKNITFDFSNKFTNKSKLDHVIETAQLKKKISQIPEGLNTLVGNNGIKLSGGERQRIAISRALYQDPEILFLDEFTSALDAQTEKLIMEQIKLGFKNKTIILIAHRKSLLSYCDEIWELEKGKLREI